MYYIKHTYVCVNHCKSDMSWRRLLNKPKRRQKYLMSISRQILVQKFFPQSILFFKLVKFDQLRNGAHRYSGVIFTMFLFPSFDLECGPLIWTWTRITMIKVRKSFASRCWNCKSQNTISSILARTWRRFTCWRLGHAFGYCHPSRCKIDVTFADSGPCGSLLVGPVDWSRKLKPVWAICGNWHRAHI